MLAVQVDDRLVYGRRGYLQYQQSSDVVPITLKKGLTSVFIEFSIKEERGGDDDSSPPWIASIEATKSAEAARAAYLRSNRHVLDTPLVRSLADIRTLAAPPICDSIEVRGFGGETLAIGKISASYGVNWLPSEPIPIGTYQVFIDGEFRDDLMLYGDGSVDSCAAPPTPTGIDDSPTSVQDAWAFRVRHLLRPEFVPQRTSQEWAQKLALASAGQRMRCNQKGGLVRGKINLGTFRSAFDGSVQFYQYYLPNDWHKQPLDSAPLVVFVPSVADPVRPFLKSHILANLREYENWCSVADETGCVLLWPGYTDVDYGGPLSSTFLQENLRAFAGFMHQVRPRFVLVGVCSAGVTASRGPLSPANSISGVVLWSPELLRRASRFTPGLDGDYVENRFQPETTKALAQVAEGLGKVNVAVVRDSAMLGHGNMEHLDALLEMIPNRSTITEFSYPSNEGYVWGARMKMRLRSVLKWAQDRCSYSADQKPAAATSVPGTVVETLAGGFSVGSIPHPLSRWHAQWNKRFSIWRGNSLPEKNACSQVVARVTGLSLRPEERLPEFLPPHVREQLNSNPNPIFGIVASNNAEVVVFARCDADCDLPDVDPLLDGWFSGIIFVRSGQTWVPTFLW